MANFRKPNGKLKSIGDELGAIVTPKRLLDAMEGVGALKPGDVLINPIIGGSCVVTEIEIKDAHEVFRDMTEAELAEAEDLRRKKGW